MQILVDDQVIHYEKSGSGPALLLVHGWGDSLSTFYDLSQSLSKKFEVYLVDLPGFGQSTLPKRALDLIDYASYLNQFISKLKIKVYGLVGHSNGGAILIYGLAHKKFTAQKLVLISSAGIRDKDQLKKVALKVTAKSGRALTAFLPHNLRQSVKKKFYGTIGSDMLAVPEMEQTYKKIVAHDVQKEAGELNLPTLIIYGSDDKTTPTEYGKIFNRLIKKSDLKVIDNAAHFVHHDQPVQVAKFVNNFLNE